MSLQDLTCLICSGSTHRRGPGSRSRSWSRSRSRCCPQHPLPPRPAPPRSSPALITDRYRACVPCVGPGVSSSTCWESLNPEAAAPRSVHYKRSDFLTRSWANSQSASSNSNLSDVGRPTEATWAPDFNIVYNNTDMRTNWRRLRDNTNTEVQWEDTLISQLSPHLDLHLDIHRQDPDCFLL